MGQLSGREVVAAGVRVGAWFVASQCATGHRPDQLQLGVGCGDRGGGHRWISNSDP